MANSTVVTSCRWDM